MANTYYVSAATGNDSDTGLTEALAWLTVDKAMNTVAAGDKVWVKADGNYAELATIDTVGTATAPIVFEGYTTAPGDGGRATITGSSSRANCVADGLAAGTDIFYAFKNLRFTAATGVGFLTDCNQITFKNCKFDTNGSSGLQCRLVGCEGCEFSSNTNGVEDTVGSKVFIGCRFYSNTYGIVSSNAGFATVLIGCTFFSNSAVNIYVGGANSLHVIANCTVDGDAKDSNSGLELDNNTGFLTVLNTVLYDCVTGYSSPGNMGERVISRNNCVNGNTTAYTNATTFTGEVISAPAFVDEVAGADYHPDTGSPLRDAGFDGGASMDIGAVQSVAGAASNVFKLRIGV